MPRYRMKGVHMNVNGFTTTQTANAYAYANQTDYKKQNNDSKAVTPNQENTDVIYEHTEAGNANQNKKIYKQDTNLIQKLKADAEERTAQLRNLVQQMMTKQTTAYGQANDIWKFLKEGNYTVDPAVQAQAQADIAEDGYWGVEQTSDRIIQFATALTGGDPDKIEEMRDAFIKGYELAKKAFDDELPEISQQTYDRVMEKFDQLQETPESDTDSKTDSDAVSD